MVASAISSPMYYKKTDDDTYEPGNVLPILDYWIRSYLNIDDIRERNVKKWKKQMEKPQNYQYSGWNCNKRYSVPQVKSETCGE